MRKKNGFTLIELLAVIIILSILIIIAIPAVTEYISNSRRVSYIDTIKSMFSGARNFVNQGKVNVFDTDITYYIDSRCIVTENHLQSPYGEFDSAYVIVTYDENNFNYYWTGRDENGHGIRKILKSDSITEDDIESNVLKEEIMNNVGIDGREYYVTINMNSNCKKGEKLRVAGNLDYDGEGILPVCIRAESLHTEKCNKTSGFCAATVGNGGEIKYGRLGSGKTFKSGDAFDCDLNGDGLYNERFYYVSDYYDTKTNEFDSTTAVLVYYKYFKSGTGATTNGIAYNSGNKNYEGPVTLLSHLPTTSEWSNVTLKNSERQILADSTNSHNLTIANGKNLPLFSYEGKAARLLTVQEVMKACGITKVLSGTSGELDTCTFFFEGSNFGGNVTTTYGPWLETVHSINSTAAFRLNSESRSIMTSNSNATNKGYKPVIELPKTVISTESQEDVEPVEVTFKANGGKFDNQSTTNVVSYIPGSKTIVSGQYKIPTREGYSFVGWKSSIDNEIHQNLNGMKFYNSMTFTAQWQSTSQYTCIRVTDETKLHKEVCNISSKFCSKVVSVGANVVYGRAKEFLTDLEAGDAFDCDLNGNGVFNERFYYVSDYYNTITDEFDTNTAVLVYASYYKSGTGATTSGVAYNSSKKNYEGPLSLIGDLPTTSEWSNVSLKMQQRQLKAEYDTTHSSNVANGKNLAMIDYTGKAARLLTLQETMAGCGITKVKDGVSGEINNCLFLLEGSNFTDSTKSTYGPWFETVYYKNSTSGYRANSEDITIKGSAVDATNKGARPTIEVDKTKIMY